MYNSKPASAAQGLLSGLSDPTIMDMYMYGVRTHTHIHTSSPHSRGFPFLEQNGREGDVEDDLLDLARHWLELQLNVVLKGHGGGILPMLMALEARIFLLPVESTCDRGKKWERERGGGGGGEGAWCCGGKGGGREGNREGTGVNAE